MATRTPREMRIKRHRRLRKKVAGTGECPRLCIFRSNVHVYAQVIDDVQGHTLVSVSTTEQVVHEQANGKNKVDQAHLVGKLIAERALSKGITHIVFDRGGFKYHGRVKAVADGAREAGLTF